MRKLAPAGQWGWNEVLLNKIEYALRILVWQNTEDGHERHPQHTPEPFRPSFIPKPKKPKKEEVMDIDDLKAYLSKPRISAKVEANE